MTTMTIGMGVILIMVDTVIITHIIHTIIKQEIAMYRYYRPYPYYRRYYNINPYYYYRRYYPYYNVIDSQIADVDQSIINYGDMIDVIQDADVYQSMAAESNDSENKNEEEIVEETEEIVEETEEITSEEFEEYNVLPPSPFISLQ